MLLMLPGVNPNGMKKLLGNGVSTFFISEVQFLHSWVFDDFILADQLLAKALQRLETYPSVNEDSLEY